jgi:hypothetical protein
VLIIADDQVLSAMLTTVSDQQFRGLLIGMSFIDSSPASIAVQQSLYALIALYVYGHTLSMPFKVNAITALSQSIESCSNAKDGLQHIVAGILLSLYEVEKMDAHPKMRNCAYISSDAGFLRVDLPVGSLCRWSQTGCEARLHS